MFSLYYDFAKKRDIFRNLDAVCVTFLHAASYYLVHLLGFYYLLNMLTIHFISPGRMTASTNLVTQQHIYTEKMRECLTAEQRSYYGEYFERFTRYVGLVGGETREPDALEDPTLKDMFAAALLEETPALRYKHEPLRYTLYYNLMRIAPLASLRYWLMEKLIVMPKYTEPERR